MIFWLRHISVRLWLLICWGLPTGFWLMTVFPELQRWPVMAAGLAVMGLIQGVLLDIIGIRRIRGLVREGELWEQAGLRSKAEKSYRKALRVYDSIMVSPWSARKLSLFLSRALAGFYLTGKTGYPGFEPAAARYLIRHPSDDTLALLWLERHRSGRADPGSADVMTALAQALHAHPKVGPYLVPFFVRDGRTDVTAKRLYRSVLNMEEHRGKVVSGGLKEKMTSLLGGVRLGDPAEPAGGKESVAVAGGPTLGDQVFGSDGMPGHRTPFRAVVHVLKAPGAGVVNLIRAVCRGAAALGKRLPGVAPASVKRLTFRLLAAALTVWLGVFLYGALTHMLKPTGADPEILIENDQGAFTIQVAAYLKLSHADGYLKKLKKLGLPAYVKEARGGGKTWYLVRISHFRDQETAAAYGRKLKSEKKIDDFFVSNN